MTTIEIRDPVNAHLIHRLPIYAHHQIRDAAVCGQPVKSARHGYDLRPVPAALRMDCRECQ